MVCFQEYVNLAFILSDDPGSTMVPPGFPLPAPPTAAASPLSHLTHVLSTLPNLRTFATRLPDAWNENILCVSRNPVLERIAIEDFSSSTGHGYEHAYRYGMHGRGHFLNEAKKHPRLHALIRAGTTIDSGFGRFVCLLYVQTDSDPQPATPYSSTPPQTTPLFTPPPPPSSQTSTSQTYVFSCSSIVAQSQRVNAGVEDLNNGFHNHDHNPPWPHPRPWSTSLSSNQTFHNHDHNPPWPHPRPWSTSLSSNQTFHNHDHNRPWPHPRPWSTSLSSNQTPSQHPSHLSSSSSRSRPVSTSSLTIQSSSTPSQHHSFSSPSGSRSRPVPSLGSGPDTLADKISDPVLVSTSADTPGPGPLPRPSTSNRRKRTLPRRESGEDKSKFFSKLHLLLAFLT